MMGLGPSYEAFFIIPAIGSLIGMIFLFFAIRITNVSISKTRPVQTVIEETDDREFVTMEAGPYTAPRTVSRVPQSQSKSSIEVRGVWQLFFATYWPIFFVILLFKSDMWGPGLLVSILHEFQIKPAVLIDFLTMGIAMLILFATQTFSIAWNWSIPWRLSARITAIYLGLTVVLGGLLIAAIACILIFLKWVL